MKRIQYSKYGGPELMRLEDFELSSPGKDEVAVQVRYAAINPIDWKLRSGVMKIVTGKTFPRAMGMDFSGTVIRAGADVTRLKVGDAVMGLARFKESGAFAQAVVTKEAFLAKNPNRSRSKTPPASARRASRPGTDWSTRQSCRPDSIFSSTAARARSAKRRCRSPVI
ncbi:alcohol dehydrogenase catalytic domain-containing protein [Pseudomonas viridiflava]|nr:alcohol dehydrogenase catalytic domain-containing protein [Pseudomonas viridiflava]MCJ8176204.1 alcohol dehydrogenase catalytic domain-containing protein [Pseudomonas viridiflava]